MRNAPDHSSYAITNTLCNADTRIGSTRQQAIWVNVFGANARCRLHWFFFKTQKTQRTNLNSQMQASMMLPINVLVTHAPQRVITVHNAKVFTDRDASCKGGYAGHHIPDNTPVRNAKAPNKSGLLRLFIGFTSREPNALSVLLRSARCQLWLPAACGRQRSLPDPHVSRGIGRMQPSLQLSAARTVKATPLRRITT